MADSDDPNNGSFHKRLKCRPTVRSYLLIYVGLTRCYLRVGWGMKVLTPSVGWSEGGRFWGGGAGGARVMSFLSWVLRLGYCLLFWSGSGEGEAASLQAWTPQLNHWPQHPSGPGCPDRGASRRHLGAEPGKWVTDEKDSMLDGVHANDTSVKIEIQTNGRMVADATC